MARTTQENLSIDRTPSLYIAFELSKKTWKLAFSTSRTQKPRIRDVEARDIPGLLAEIALAKKRFNLPVNTRLLSCYEAGRDGFWIHRVLAANGVSNIIIDPASIEVSRRARRVKTDRVDAQKMVQLLARHDDGEDVLHVVRVPSPEAEDERLLPRELSALKSKRTEISNKMISMLFLHGIELSPRVGGFVEQAYLKKLRLVRLWDGSELPPGLLGVINRLWEQFALLTTQINELSQRQKKLMSRTRKDFSKGTVAQQKGARLSTLQGIGDIGGYLLSTEFFAWREFKNRGQVGALAGLTGTPFQSGGSNKEQGISKSGNPRVRKLMVELAWLWLRWQPDSKTTRWYHDCIGKGAVAVSEGRSSPSLGNYWSSCGTLWSTGFVPKGQSSKRNTGCKSTSHRHEQESKYGAFEVFACIPDGAASSRSKPGKEMRQR